MTCRDVKRNTKGGDDVTDLLETALAFMALSVVSGGASAEECSGSTTAEEVLRAEDARYTAQIANDFAAMEQMSGPELVYIRSADGAVADKRPYIESIRSDTVKYRAMRRSDVRVRTYGCLASNSKKPVIMDLTVRGGDLSERSVQGSRSLAEQQRPTSSSIFLLDVPRHGPPHLDQTTPNLPKERLKLGLARLCA